MKRCRHVTIGDVARLGGKALAAKLSALQRKQKAKKAAEARWKWKHEGAPAPPPVKATRRTLGCCGHLESLHDATDCYHKDKRGIFDCRCKGVPRE